VFGMEIKNCSSKLSNCFKSLMLKKEEMNFRNCAGFKEKI